MYKYKIVYRIYEIVEGLLKEPKQNYYGHQETVFDDFDTMEDALKALAKKNVSGLLVILPVVDCQYELD